MLFQFSNIIFHELDKESDDSKSCSQTVFLCIFNKNCLFTKMKYLYFSMKY